MGDIIEFTTYSKNVVTFYEASSSAIVFEIKSNGNAAIGLAKGPKPIVNYWVVIGENNHKCWIRQNLSRACTEYVSQSDILSEDEYRRFWITWENNYVRLGRFGDENPFLEHQSKALHLKLVTFTSSRDGHCVNWRFEVPPMTLSRNPVPIDKGELRWVPWTGTLPPDAVIGGHEREVLYIVKAPHSGSITPGKLVLSLLNGTGILGWNKQNHMKSEFEVLCGYDCEWVPGVQDRVPVNAVEGGRSENATSEPLFVGRALFNGHVIPGKVQPSHKCCYIPFQGDEINMERFEVLVRPCKGGHIRHEVFLHNCSGSLANDNQAIRDPGPIMPMRMTPYYHLEARAGPLPQREVSNHVYWHQINNPDYVDQYLEDDQYSSEDEDA